METLKKLLQILTIHERKRAVLLLGMILAMALLDLIGVASILPFIAVLANPQLVETNIALSTAFQIVRHLGISTIENFFFLLGILVFVLLIVSLGFKALVIYAQLRFTQMREYSLSKRLVEGYLRQPYSWFLNRHSADLGKTILSEVRTVIGGSLAPMINLIAQSIVTLTILVFLVIVNPLLACATFLVFAVAYLAILKTTKQFLYLIGEERARANKECFIAVTEVFGAAKEVKVAGLEDVFIQRFVNPAYRLARYNARASVISQLPRFALEAIVFGGILMLMLHLMTQSGNLANALPTIALYTFAGYRLMPALQQIYSSITQLRFGNPVLDALHSDLIGLHSENVSRLDQTPLVFSKAIELNNIVYSYPGTSQIILKNVSLTIPANTIVGIVGTTGSGKTTLVDVILNLLEPQEGTVSFDGQVITDQNRRQWQRTIGYVPQQIYLADDTVSANIAFGVDAEDWSYEAIERAARIANLHEFVTNDLTHGYNTTVGERGVRLSGGQRQRIGIARALYRNPKILIMDEATSALDNLTEQAVMDAVNNLGHDITIILIAHRLSTVKQCDNILLMDKGNIVDKGTYEELSVRNNKFAAMVKST